MCLGTGRAAPPEPAQADPRLGSFIHAVRVDDEGKVKALLGAGLDPNARDPVGGEPALVLAVREGSSRVFGVLIVHPASNIELNAPNGNTALMMAAFRRDRPAVLALLAKNAIVNRPGWTALHYAAASGDDDIVRILLEHYAYIDCESPSKLTPLMIAAREGHESTARLLMEEGADATLRNNESLSAAQIAERADKPRIAAAIAAHLAARSSAGK
jgi:uncharacterized protein